MENKKSLKYVSLAFFVFVIGFFIYTINISKATSYLSDDPKSCLNCHVMNNAYASWQHDSHVSNATCVDCHLPQKDILSKLVAKVEDGYHHSKAFTLNSYTQTIRISEKGAARVQENCISCHSNLTSKIVDNENIHILQSDSNDTTRYCWDCHRGVPHGTVRGLTSTPNNLGVREAN